MSLASVDVGLILKRVAVMNKCVSLARYRAMALDLPDSDSRSKCRAKKLCVYTHTTHNREP